MKFDYQARTKKGEIQSGVIEASSLESAAALLQKHGLYVTTLEETAKPPIYARRIKLFERIPNKEIVLFSRQLSMMFQAKVSLTESLRVLASQTGRVDFREKIFKLAEEVEGGTSFSVALSSQTKVFSPFYIAMVKAGEASGNLSESLVYLADHLEREYHFNSKIKGAMIYPAMIVLVAVAVLTLMMFFVVPQMTKILLEAGGQLPLATEIVIALSEFLRKWAWILFPAIVGLIIFLFKYRQTENGKEFFDKNFLKLPAIGPFLKMTYLSRFAENLATLISSGLPIAQSLEITAAIVGNTVYQQIIFIAQQEVRKGETISSVLSRFPNFFPPIFIQMTVVGEKTGSLDKTLLNLVDFYRKEVDRNLESLLTILEPLLIVFLGLVVGGIMAAILLPLYQVAAF